MSTEQNKAVVRRFITEVLVGGNVAAADEVLGQTYRNEAVGIDLAGFIGFLSGLVAAIPVRQFDISDLVAEGDLVVARGNIRMANPIGQSETFRFLTYYRLADGKIVEDEPITAPELAPSLAKLAPSLVAAH